jgi:hypothetical protein
VGKLLLHISKLFKSGVVDSAQRETLKMLALKEEKRIVAALKAFEAENDMSEFIDTLKHIARSTSHNEK